MCLKTDHSFMSKPFAYSYIRMSTDIQLKGDSLRRQTDLSKSYAAEHNLELVEDFNLHDIGVSAYTGANIAQGALGKFLDAARIGDIPKGSFLLVETWDRLSRQKIERSVSLFFEIIDYGINIVTLADGQVYMAGNAELGQLIYSIVVMARAHEESETKSKRIASAWENKRANISKQVLTKQCPGWLEINDDKTGFIVLVDRAKIVERIFGHAAEGHGSGLITRIFNKEKIKPFGKSNGWIESYVTKILTNRAVLGEFQPHRRINGKRVPIGEAVQFYFPQVISEDLFLNVQAGRRKRTISGAGRKGAKQRNLFTHIAICDYCGSSMRFINKGNGPKGGTYLRCSASVRGMGCVSKTWRYINFEQSLFSFVREFDLTRVIENTQKRSKTTVLGEKIVIEKERLRDQEIARQRVFDLVANADAAKEFLSSKLEQLSFDISHAMQEIERLEVELAEFEKSDSVGVNADLQLSAIQKFSAKSDLNDRLLVSSKLKTVIKEIRVATDGKKPNFKRIRALIDELDDDEKFKSKLIETLRENHFNGPRANPYFTVIFHTGASRIVIPSPENPLELILQSDVVDGDAQVTDGSGSVVARFISSDRDGLNNNESDNKEATST